MRINIHAGHNPDGKVACGTVGFIRESVENRRVKDEVISKLRQLGDTVYDCTCDTGKSVSDVLTKILTACNSHDVDLDVSIHFNSGVKDKEGNGKTTGVEVLVYSLSGKATPYAERVCSKISELGFKNRGVKERKDLRFLRQTKAPAMLIECCFVDDKDDVQLYECQKMADAIVYAITGMLPGNYSVETEDEKGDPGEETQVGTKGKLGRVQVGAYSVPENAEAMKKKLVDAGFKDAIIVWS